MVIITIIIIIIAMVIIIIIILIIIIIIINIKARKIYSLFFCLYLYERKDFQMTMKSTT